MKKSGEREGVGKGNVKCLGIQIIVLEVIEVY